MIVFQKLFWLHVTLRCVRLWYQFIGLFCGRALHASAPFMLASVYRDSARVADILCANNTGTENNVTLLRRPFVFCMMGEHEDRTTVALTFGKELACAVVTPSEYMSWAREYIPTQNCGQVQTDIVSVEMMSERLSEGYSVVMDDNYVSSWRRLAVEAFAHRYGATVVYVVVGDVPRKVTFPRSTLHILLDRRMHSKAVMHAAIIMETHAANDKVRTYARLAKERIYKYRAYGSMCSPH